MTSPPINSHFEHFVFYIAFDKAKNAHFEVESPIRTQGVGMNDSYVQARRFIHFYTLCPE